MFRIGLIGAGKWGANHLRIFSELSKSNICEFIGVADLNPETEKLAQKHNIKFFKDYKEMIPLVDAVSVVVPTNFHYDVVKECLNNNKHVFVEKPITMQAETAKELAQIAKDNNLVLRIGYLFRFNPAVQKLKQEIKENIGKIHYITARYMHSNKPPRKDSGVVFNFAVHLIDILNFILEKKPIKVFCKNHYHLSEDKEDAAIITLDYGDFVANLEVTWFHPLKVRDMWIIGEKEKVYADLLEQIIQKHPIEITHDKIESKSKINLEIHKNEPLKEELKHFCTMVDNHKFNLHINDNQKPLDEEAYITTKICELCIKSAQEGRELEVK